VFRFQGSGFRVQGSGLRLEGLPDDPSHGDVGTHWNTSTSTLGADANSHCESYIRTSTLTLRMPGMWATFAGGAPPAPPGKGL